MTSAKTVANVILDEGGDNALTVYTTSCEKVYSKRLTGITAPQSTANKGDGPKDTKIVDLLRIEVRLVVKGSVDSADESKIQSLFNIGGVFNMKDKDSTFSRNSEKLTITNDNKTENDETGIMFTALVGVNL